MIPFKSKLRRSTNDEGNCVFVFYEDDVACQIEYIFLRNILKLFGQQYRITVHFCYSPQR